MIVDRAEQEIRFCPVFQHSETIRFGRKRAAAAGSKDRENTMETGSGKNLSSVMGFIYIVITFFLWGSIYVSGKLVQSSFPPVLVSDLRCTIAAIPYFFLLRTRYRNVRIERGDIKYFILIGFLGYYVSQILVQIAIDLTGASTTALVNAVTPVMIMLFAAVLLKEKITPVKIFCLILALAGPIVIAGGVDGRGELGGIVLNLISVCTWSLTSVMIRKFSAKYPPVVIPAYGFLFSLIFHIPTAAVVLYRTDDIRITPVAVFGVLYLGIFCSSIAQYTWSMALSVFPAGTCSLFYPLQPIFSALLGYFLLNERFGPEFFIGLLLISLDVILVTLSTARESRKAVS